MALLASRLAGLLGGVPAGGGVAPNLPQEDADAPLAYSNGLQVLPQSDTGTDVSLLQELTGDWPVQGGDAALAEDILRRITTPRGRLDFSPNDGIDVRDELRDDMSGTDVFHSKQAIENEVAKDERVDDVAVALSLIPATSNSQATMLLTMDVTKASGAFRLVLSVSKLTVDVLNAEVL